MRRMGSAATAVCPRSKRGQHGQRLVNMVGPPHRQLVPDADLGFPAREQGQSTLAMGRESVHNGSERSGRLPQRDNEMVGHPSREVPAPDQAGSRSPRTHPSAIRSYESGTEHRKAPVTNRTRATGAGVRNQRRQNLGGTQTKTADGSSARNRDRRSPCAAQSCHRAKPHCRAKSSHAVMETARDSHRRSRTKSTTARGLKHSTGHRWGNPQASLSAPRR